MSTTSAISLLYFRLISQLLSDHAVSDVSSVSVCGSSWLSLTVPWLGPPSLLLTLVFHPFLPLSSGFIPGGKETKSTGILHLCPLTVVPIPAPSKDHLHLSIRGLWHILELTLWNWASLVVQTIKNLLAMEETWVRFLGQEDPLEKGMATYSSLLA